MAEKGVGEKSDANGTEILEEIRTMCGKLLEKQTEQDESIKKILEKQNEQDTRKQRREAADIEIPAKNANLESAAAKEQEELVPVLAKSFVLKHVFENVSSTEEDMYRFDYEEERGTFSDWEEHFGLEWNLGIEKNGDSVKFFLFHDKASQSDVYSIKTMCTMKFIHLHGKVFSKSGSYTFNQNGDNGLGEYEFMKWEEMKNDYLIGDKLTVEAHVTILKMSGIYKDDLRRFDESMGKVSDVILIVQDEKFFVSKLYLATHSPYFEALFLGGFDESQQSEVTLIGAYSDDFQKYLEVLYAETAVDELTVEGLLRVAEMYDTNIIMRKCEEFLLKDTKKRSKTKFRIAFRYNLNELKKKCLSEIKTVYDIRSMIPADINEMDPSVTSALLEKCLALK